MTSQRENLIVVNDSTVTLTRCNSSGSADQYASVSEAGVVYSLHFLIAYRVTKTDAMLQEAEPGVIEPEEDESAHLGSVLCEIIILIGKFFCREEILV